jgi:uncharacterized protein (TIGR02118 family)
MTEQGKPTKISFVYSNPTDPDAFEAAYPDQIALARKLPGLTRLQASKVWPKEDGSPTPAYRLLDLYFADYAAAGAAAAEAGPLVNVLSAMSWFGIKGGNAYHLTRAAAWAMTNGVRLELAEQGTLVTGGPDGALRRRSARTRQPQPPAQCHTCSAPRHLKAAVHPPWHRKPTIPGGQCGSGVGRIGDDCACQHGERHRTDRSAAVGKEDPIGSHHCRRSDSTGALCVFLCHAGRTCRRAPCPFHACSSG